MDAQKEFIMLRGSSENTFTYWRLNKSNVTNNSIHKVKTNFILYVIAIKREWGFFRTKKHVLGKLCGFFHYNVQALVFVVVYYINMIIGH